ncbi:MAG: T9SS type A sorting domain-containing protein [Bacteroidetes bacterium]|nr:T9SS type A sorting domain-containing protein [Bacteroidota bacterium]
MKNIKYILSVIIFIAGCSIAKAQYQNIFITSTGSPNEPSICINPKNTDQLVAGSNLNFYYYSTNSGYNWTRGTLSSTYSVWGDPSITVDTAGNFYYGHLTNPSGSYFIDRIVVQKSTNGGANWSNGSFTGFIPPKQQDKEWLCVDPRNNNIYMTWTQFDSYGSSSPSDSSIILFSRSTDAGETWSSALRINKKAGDCLDGDNTVEGAVPAVGPNGEIYVSWSGPLGIVMDRSTDGGLTWLDNDIFVTTQPTGWDYDIPGISRANGLPVTNCDISNGPNRGTIYINWSDQRNGATDTDIWMIKSTDGGNTWSAVKRVNNDPPGKQQFFTWMTIDQKDGTLYFVFYDRRNYSSNQTDVYMGRSTDAGETISNFKVSETPFTPSSSVFFGDYTNITAFNGKVRPIWARADNTSMSLYTAIVDFITNVQQINSVKPDSFRLYGNYPNPFNPSTKIKFDVSDNSRSNVKITVYDTNGKEIIKLVDGNLQPGTYEVEWNALNFASGTYYAKLEAFNFSDTKVMMFVK